MQVLILLVTYGLYGLFTLTKNKTCLVLFTGKCHHIRKLFIYLTWSNSARNVQLWRIGGHWMSNIRSVLTCKKKYTIVIWNRYVLNSIHEIAILSSVPKSIMSWFSYSIRIKPVSNFKLLEKCGELDIINEVTRLVDTFHTLLLLMLKLLTLQQPNFIIITFM